MRHGDYGWVAVGAAVAAYEIAAGRKQWELLSDAVDRYRNRHPILTNTVVLAVGLHLLRALPERLDPIHRLAEALK